MLVSEIPALRDFWYPVAYSDRVAAEPVAAELFGERYVVWRPAVDGPPSAARDACPHRGARLSQGWLADGCLTCPYHGWRYDGSGACMEIPANEPHLPVPPRARLATVHAEDRYGLVWVCVGTPRAGVPTLPECDDPSYVVVHELMEGWRASAPRVIDNGLDVSHVAWVHRNSVGTDGAPRLTDLEVTRDGPSLRFSASYTARINAQQRANTGIESELTTRSTHGELVQPLLFRGVLEYHETGLRHVLYKTATPIDDTRTLFCQFVARNDAPDEAKRRGIVALDRQVQDEDKALLEEIDPDFPVELGAEIHTRSDRMTVEYRRILAELAAEPSPPAGLPADALVGG